MSSNMTSIKFSKETTEKVKEIMTDKSSNEVVEGSGKKLPLTNYEAMDSNNKKAADVLASKGSSEAIKFMFTDQDTGRQLSYAEMRYRYG